MMKVILSDGTILDNLDINGNNFISTHNLTADDFKGKLSTVTIEDGDYISTMTDCALFDLVRRSGKTWFVIGEKTERMKQEERNTELELALTELYEMIIGG